MRERLLHFLVCPIDRGPLELRSWEESAQPLSDAAKAQADRLGIEHGSLERVIRSGVLVNPRLNLYYPIINGVPRMLVFQSSVHAQFLETFGDRVKKELGDMHLSDLPPAPGERDVLRSFSAEWLNYDWDGGAYWNLSHDDWNAAMRYLLDTEHYPLAGKRVLEVGIGIGGTANDLAAKDGCELVGVDLGYATDAAVRHFASNPFLHVVQCSVFNPPFREETFDFVYSHGVIHHTYSTKAAFDQLSRLPKHGGRIYVWVYSYYDEQRTWIRRVLMGMESVSRPVISRLPDPLQTLALSPLVPAYIGFQALRRLKRGPNQVLYGPKEAMHAARDRFAPRFIHRHDEKELISWLQSAGYQDISPGSARPAAEHVPVHLLAAAFATGTRT